ncbi:MAG: hypothetical protein LAN71_11100 [Acidobacteriia bacterium]|nr:hypothetical protein [Terriglobia bacterium]
MPCPATGTPRRDRAFPFSRSRPDSSPNSFPRNPPIRLLLPALLAAFLLCPVSPAAAQQPETPPPAIAPQPPPAPPPQDENNKRPPVHNGTSNDRLLYTLPNFLTVETTDKIPPLTTQQKFAVVARSSFDPVQFPWYGFLAGISQAQNNQKGYGQGAIGYAKRYGAAWADGTTEYYWTAAILPSVLRQDPRYYQMGTGGFWRRLGYAISRTVITRGDSGNTQFNCSEFCGTMISSAISTYTYYPRTDSDLRNAGILWGSLLSYDALTFIGREFWPDIRRKREKKRHPDAGVAPAAPGR